MYRYTIDNEKQAVYITDEKQIYYGLPIAIRELFHDLCEALSAYSEEWKWIVDNLFVPKCKFLGHCPETDHVERK